LLLLLITGSASAQSDVIINTATLCIAEGRYNDAERYLDSLIQADPKNIDALMMKGNVLLNYALMTTPAMSSLTPENEISFSDEIAGPYVLIPREQAQKIEAIWNECLLIDSNRLDIREGLCTVYGMADMKKELLAYLPLIARAGKEKGDDFVNVLLQYGDLLHERGDREGTYAVYKKVAALYPTVGNVWCRFSAISRFDDAWESAKAYAEKAFTLADIDPRVCEDALDLYALDGGYSRALGVIKAADKDAKERTLPFYEGLLHYARHDSTWRRSMQEYVKQFMTEQDTNANYQAAKYMLAPTFKSEYKDLVPLLGFASSELYMALITDRYIADYRDSVLPSMIKTERLFIGHDYTKAITVYEATGSKKLKPEIQTPYQIQYAIALYRTKQYDKAITQWTALKASDAAIGSRALCIYFLAQSYLKAGNKEKAKATFQELVARDEDNKYVGWAKELLKKL